MKICFVHEEYPEETNFGGIATYQKIMAEYYANNGDDVFVVTRGKHDRKYVENNVKIIRVSSENDVTNIDSVKNYRKKVAHVLFELQKNEKIDIIETPDWGANTIYFELFRNVPLVVRLHTPLKIWLKYNNNDFGASKNIILKWEDTMLKNADAITSCSKLLKGMVIDQYDINKNIIVIPNPYNNKDFNVVSKKDNNNLIYVGSLEERKGVILLANALNRVLSDVENNYVYVVGKDTNRNNKNISTKEYMLSLIDEKYHNRIKFVGQISNSRVNEYLNDAYLAIFPSSFDNYPYTILEAMASGKCIICSDNIGSADLVQLNNYIFKTGDLDDLIDKILLALKNKSDFINYDNVRLVNEECNQKYICEKMKNVYIDTIEDYKDKKSKENEAICALKKVIRFKKIYKIEQASGNLANIVYIAFTDVGNYVVKRYNYNYDFNLCNELYDVYEMNSIRVVRPINTSVLNVDGISYNIFSYLKPSIGKLSSAYEKKIINIERKINRKANILSKCDKYYDYLYDLQYYNKFVEKDELFTLRVYNKIKNFSLFNEQYLNHGDLSLSNIVFHDNHPYIIDFDETVITTKLYDYAVMFVKNHIKDIKINYDSIINYITTNIPDVNYSVSDYLIVIKFYLCKILLEKFYLYEKGNIDLFCEFQLKDDYKKYVEILKLLIEGENSNE